MKPLLQWKRNKYYVWVCVCVCVWSVVGTRAQAHACARVALIIQHATHRHIVIRGLSGSTIFFDVRPIS
jgi:hypothetical protein